MKHTILQSLFASRIKRFISFKNELGYSYYESKQILFVFDEFCREHFPEKDKLDQELGLAWLERRETEGAAAHRNRVMVIREFAKYLNSIGETAYLIPIFMTRKASRYVPHIFSQNELTAFFNSADHFAPHDKSPLRHLVIPVFYRLLYCCGLRPAEARLLRRENVNLLDGVIQIVESKGHRDRLVVVSDDLLQLLRKYAEKSIKIYPESPFLFPRHDGNGAYTKVWTQEMFWRCFEMAGITSFEGPKPRVYDFRHTFASHCIVRWIREGRNVDAMLPYLSAYMGHASLEDTMYYIHLVPEFYQSMSMIDLPSYEALLPEVPYEN